MSFSRYPSCHETVLGLVHAGDLEAWLQMLTDVSLPSPESGCHLHIYNPLSVDSCNKMPQGFNLTASRGAAPSGELFEATQDHCHSRRKAGAGMTVTGIAPLNQN